MGANLTNLGLQPISATCAYICAHLQSSMLLLNPGSHPHPKQDGEGDELQSSLTAQSYYELIPTILLGHFQHVSGWPCPDPSWNVPFAELPTLVGTLCN